MPSPRRLKIVTLLIVATIVGTGIYKLGQSNRSEFAERTINGLGRARGGEMPHKVQMDSNRDGVIDNDDATMAKEMSDRLKAAEARAKKSANDKAPRPDSPNKVIGVGSSAGGQKKGKDGTAVEKVEEEETEEDHEIETTLNEILKKSPVIIFSKSYCPHSKRAKGLLLEKYSIQPAPYVVELDKHPLGLQMQARLGTMTGRTTVPNIMINGKSIGGADDVFELDGNHALVEKIKTLGGKRVEMEPRFTAGVDSNAGPQKGL